MKPTLDVSEAVLVLVGKFSPALITPGWLANYDLISLEQAKEAEVSISHPEVSQFSFGALTLFVDSNRLQVKTNQSPFVEIGDFAAKLLAELLHSTPVWAVGINLSQHYRVDLEARDRFGERLSPRELWGDWGKNTFNHGADKSSGLVSVTMRQGRDLEDRESGHIEVRIESSSVVKGSALNIHVNDHYSIGESDKIFDSLRASEIIRGGFDASIRRSEQIASGIVEQIQ